MARTAPGQNASPFAGRQRTAAWAAAAGALLVLVAAVAHVRGGHRAELLQSAAGRERRMQALSELGGQSQLLGAERMAFMNGFRAGEETAERDVMEDEEARAEGAKLAGLRKAIHAQGSEIKKAEEERALLLSQNSAREAAARRTEEERAVLYQKAAREAALRRAEEERAMLLSEKSADYALAWQEAAEKRVQAEAMAHAEVKFDRKAAAAARLQQKHAEAAGVQAKPGTKRAAELLDFCAQEFGDDKALQQFCYDKLISKPYGDAAVLEQPSGEELRERVVDAPTIQDAMAQARREGLDSPPQFAELANGELYRVMPLQKALKQHVAKMPAPVQQALSVHRAGNGGVEVDAPSLMQSVEEAHRMGFKGSPEAVVYHPADGKPVVYKLETPQQAQQLAQVPHAGSGPGQLEVDARTLKGSIAKAHAMGLKGHPEAIVYHEANGKTELYEAQPSKPQQLAAKPQLAQQQINAEVKSTNNGEVEVEAKTLMQSLAEAHKMGFKGQPQAIVYHPAHGKPETYVLQHNTPVRARKQ